MNPHVFLPGDPLPAAPPSGTMQLLDYICRELDDALARYEALSRAHDAAIRRLWQLDDFDGLATVAAVTAEHQEDA